MALDSWSANFSSVELYLLPPNSRYPPPPTPLPILGSRVWGGDNNTLVPLSVQPVTSCHTLRSVNSVLSCWEGMHEANGAGIGKVNSPQGGSAATRAPVWRRRSSS